MSKIFLKGKLIVDQARKRFQHFFAHLIVVIDLASWPRFFVGANIGLIIGLAISRAISIGKKVADGFFDLFFCLIVVSLQKC